MVYQEKKRGVTRLIGQAPTSPLIAWPVNAVYISFSSANPSTLFGGTWTAIGTGQMLIGVDPSDTAMDAAGDTGGAKTTTLTTANLPPHTHTITHDHNARFSDAAGASITHVPKGTQTESAVANNPIQNTNTPDSGNGPGSSTPFTNLPPYVAVYMWRRTA